MALFLFYRKRGYVILDKKRFHPENRGRVVTTFLTEFFGQYVDYDFTAGLENKLDDISKGGKGSTHGAA